MEKRIGIIGAGVAGLHLGLYLRQHDIDVTIISDRTAEQISKSRLPNTAAHFAATIESEKMLGADHWSDPEFHYTCHNHSFGGGPQRLEFCGTFTRPSCAVDHRIYVPRLMEDFASRGGTIEVKAVDALDLGLLAQRFDLLVVASGRGKLAQTFECVAGGSPYDRPQRRLLAGLFSGIGGLTPWERLCRWPPAMAN